MLIKLSLQNIREKKIRNLLACFSIAISIASVLVFLSLSNGIQNTTFQSLEKNSPLTQITVHPNTQKTGVISLFTRSSKDMLTTSTIEQLKKIDGIKTIYPEIQFNSFASLEASVLGFDFVTDAMVFGVDEGFVDSSITSQNPIKTWQSDQQPYPTIIPRQLLDIYNFAIASPQGLPLMSEKDLIGKKIKLYPNYSTFFPSMSGKTTSLELSVVGFSDSVNLIGVTVPYSLVEKLNKEYTNEPNPKFVEIFVDTVSADKTEEVAKQIDNLGLSTSYFQKNLKEVEAKIKYLNLALGIISIIILLSSTIAIISIFLTIAEERKKEIGLFRALGATKNHIRIIILTEAGIIGFIGSLSGIIIGFIASIFLDKFAISKLADTSFTPETLFPMPASLIFTVLIFGIILTIFSALLPAQKAANTDPIQALK